MREYLKERKQALQKQYSDLLSLIGNNRPSENEVHPQNAQHWVDLRDINSRINEINMTIEFFNENNYTNL